VDNCHSLFIKAVLKSDRRGKMGEVNYATNVSQRTPTVLVLDASASMLQRSERSSKSRIELLNEGVKAFYNAMQEDELALSRVQIAAINVGGPSSSPEVFLEWTDAINFKPFELSARYATPLGKAMELAVETIEEQKIKLRESGISYTRPWVFVLTDGEPTDSEKEWQESARLVKQAEADGKIEVFPIGVAEANLHILSELSRRPPMMADGLKFQELFVWLSASLGQVTRSSPGQEIEMPSTDPWAAVKL
jgi:uncharacterized protein YegL